MRQRLHARLFVLVGLTTTLQVCFTASQARANEFSDWSCKHVPFADKICHTVESTNKAVDFMTDPLGYIAQFFNNAVTSLFTQMINALLATTRVDWGNPGFLRTYSMAFAASTVLTVVLWLIAVAKRALQGVAPLQALGESIGFLLISVVVSALAPAAVAYVTELFDEAAEAMFAPVAGDAASMVVTVTAGMAALMAIPGGAVIVIFLATCMLAAVAGVWLMLVVRNALILAGLVFGVSVFSGLVDKSLWNHTRRWVGVMGAVIASKYVVLTTIALATGLLSTSAHKDVSVVQAFGSVFTALALLCLALFLPFSLAKFLPLVGDEMQHMYQARDELKGRARNFGSQVGDTFAELRSRFGGGLAGGGESSAAGDGGGDGNGDGAGDGEGETVALEDGVAVSTAAGAAAAAGKKGADVVKRQAEKAADHGLSGAAAQTGFEADAAPDTPSFGLDVVDGAPAGARTGTAKSDGGDRADYSAEHELPPVSPASDQTAAVGDTSRDVPVTPPPSWPPADPSDEPPQDPADDQPR